MTELLGACDAAPQASVCIYWQRGLELEFAAGRVQRMVAHQDGDASLLADNPPKQRFGLFKGAIDEVQIGMTEDVLLNVVGGPAQTLVPLGKPPGSAASMWEYPKRGLAVEVETVDGDPQIVRIHVPLAPARPAR